MQNIRLVTEFITEQTRQAGGDVGRESMRVIPCDDGRLYHRDEEGSCWRVLSYIEAASACRRRATSRTCSSAPPPLVASSGSWGTLTPPA